MWVVGGCEGDGVGEEQSSCWRRSKSVSRELAVAEAEQCAPVHRAPVRAELYDQPEGVEHTARYKKTYFAYIRCVDVHIRLLMHDCDCWYKVAMRRVNAAEYLVVGQKNTSNG